MISAPCFDWVDDVLSHEQDSRQKFCLVKPGLEDSP